MKNKSFVKPLERTRCFTDRTKTLQECRRNVASQAADYDELKDESYRRCGQFLLCAQCEFVSLILLKARKAQHTLHQSNMAMESHLCPLEQKGLIFVKMGQSSQTPFVFVLLMGDLGPAVGHELGNGRTAGVCQVPRWLVFGQHHP